MTVSFQQAVLPWAGSAQDELRFARIQRAVLVLTTLLCLVVLLMPVIQPDRSQVQELPPRLATLILENAKPPLPPPKPVVEAATRTEQATADAPRKTAPSKEAPVPEARVPLPNKPPGEVDAARRKAAGVGLLAMSKDLAEMHGAPLAVQLAPVKQGPGVGTGVGVGVGAGTEAGLPTRALITSNALGGSGGINTAGFSRNTGGGGLAGRSTTLVEGAAGGGG
ncbi:MAG: energy transducer TonB, partial [Rhodoferax sp.]|nr:energy transducer TonB [Rhodoferax sp.]